MLLSIRLERVEIRLSEDCVFLQPRERRSSAAAFIASNKAFVGSSDLIGFRSCLFDLFQLFEPVGAKAEIADDGVKALVRMAQAHAMMSQPDFEICDGRRSDSPDRSNLFTRMKRRDLEKK